MLGQNVEVIYRPNVVNLASDKQPVPCGKIKRPNLLQIRSSYIIGFVLRRLCAATSSGHEGPCSCSRRTDEALRPFEEKLPGLST